MSICENGVRNANDIQKIFSLVAKRENESTKILVEQTRQAEELKAIKEGIEELKQLYLSDNSKRIERCEQLMSNTKDIEELKKSKASVKRQVFGCLVAVMLAIFKLAFFQ